MIKKAMIDAQQNWPAAGVQERTEKRGRLKPYQYYIDRQIVITGRPKEIDEVVRAVQGAGEHAKEGQGGSPLRDGSPLRIKTPHLARIGSEILQAFEQETAEKLAGLHEVEIRLYDLEGKESEAGVWAAIRMVHEQAAKLGYIVLADPNLIVGKPGSGGAGGVTGGPFSIPVGAPVLQGNHPFLNHWAFQPPYANASSRRRGINLEKRPEHSVDKAKPFLERRIVADTGASVRVFVLDTADSDLVNTRMIELPGGKPFGVNVYPLKQAMLVPQRSTQEEDISGHGRFVCGLLHRVAPEAQINLLQLLDDKGRGELYTLVSALFLVAADAMEHPIEANGLPLSDVVINLSLAADLSENRMLMEGVREAIDRHWEAVTQDGEGSRSVLEKRYGKNHILSKLFEDIFMRFYYGVSLRLPVILLNSLGAVIVAASGNESADRYGNMPAMVPARYPEVIGAGASNMNGKLSSFSNFADILAPGGGHADPEFPIMNLKKLQDDGQDLEPYALCSVMPPVQHDSGLAYWWGTSFATPLVAGLAALAVQKHRSVFNCCAAPDEVKEYIQNCANNGVIDVEATMKAIAKSPLAAA